MSTPYFLSGDKKQTHRCTDVPANIRSKLKAPSWGFDVTEGVAQQYWKIGDNMYTIHQRENDYFRKTSSEFSLKKI